MITLGAPAPNFTLTGIQGGEQKEYSLSDFRGGWVVLYFYPKDDTPGCTQEACEFRDLLHVFSDRNAMILGISRDAIEAHTKFIKKYGLPFVLLSDPDEKVCASYGVLKEKTLYGKKYLAIDRSTFLIDPNGALQGVWRNVKVSGHIPEVLSSIPRS